jgi:hypothetical protein
MWLPRAKLLQWMQIEGFWWHSFRVLKVSISIKGSDKKYIYVYKDGYVNKEFNLDELQAGVIALEAVVFH